MIEARLTAIVRLTYAATEEMSLDREREYDTLVEVGGKVVPSNRFKSPIGDERWREGQLVLDEALIEGRGQQGPRSERRGDYPAPNCLLSTPSDWS